MPPRRLNFARSTAKGRLPGKLKQSRKSSANDEELRPIGRISSAKHFLQWRNRKKHRTFADANAFIAREVERELKRPDYREHYFPPRWYEDGYDAE